MATIGTFKKTGNDYTGEIVTLNLQTKNVRIVPDEGRTSDKAVNRRPKRDPVNFGRVTDPNRFSSASYRIIGTAWDPTRDGLSSISPVAYRHDHGGPALDAYSQPRGDESAGDDVLLDDGQRLTVTRIPSP